MDAIFPEEADSITSIYDADGDLVVQVMPSDLPQIIRVRSCDGFTLVSAAGPQALEQLRVGAPI